MAKGNRNSNDNKQESIIMGAGLAALAAGAYFFLGPQGKKHQKNMKGWMVRMKGEVLEKIEDAKEITEPMYNEIVDTVAKANQVAGKIPQAEIAALAMDLKRQWRTLNRSMMGNKSSSRRGVKRAAPKKMAAKKMMSSKRKSSPASRKSK